MLTYVNRVQQLESVSKSMEADKDGKEMAMVILNRLPSRYDNLIPTLNDLEDDEDLFLLELVKS